jgi:hypothetical protein
MLENVEFDVTPFEIGGHILRSEDFEVILRLSPTGTVVVNQGGTEDFGDMLAYTTRLTELIGEMLGLERFVAMECSFKDSRCFVVRDDTGEIVAVKPNPSADLNGIRELLGV